MCVVIVKTSITIMFSNANTDTTTSANTDTYTDTATNATFSYKATYNIGTRHMSGGTRKQSPLPAPTLGAYSYNVYNIIMNIRISCCAVLCCVVLCCTIPYCTILHYTMLYHAILYYTILYYTILPTLGASPASPGSPAVAGAGAALPLKSYVHDVGAYISIYIYIK